MEKIKKRENISFLKLVLILVSAVIFFLTLGMTLGNNQNVLAATYKNAPKYKGKIKVPQNIGQTEVEGYYSVTKLKNNVYHINDYTKSPGGKKGKNPSSMYLIKGSQKALLIDTGNKVVKARPELVGIVNTLRGNVPLAVAITHYHEDHVGQLSAFKANTVYYPKNDQPIKNKKLRLTVNTKEHNFIWINQGDVINLGNMQFQVQNTPAHTPGSTTYIDKKDNLIASGDSIGSTFVFLNTGELKKGTKHPKRAIINTYQNTLNNLYPQVKNMKNPLFMTGHRWQGIKKNTKRGDKYTPANNPMTMQYVKDMITLTKKVKNHTATHHKYILDGKNVGTEYIYGKAEICLMTR